MGFHVPERYRITWGEMRSAPNCGNYGAFEIPSCLPNRILSVIASDGLGWEHVSAKVLDHRNMSIPTWQEMCHLKDVFWDEDDVVVQYHPRKSEYVNVHPCVLHLWRPVGIELPSPHHMLVGPLDQELRP